MVIKKVQKVSNEDGGACMQDAYKQSEHQSAKMAALDLPTAKYEAKNPFPERLWSEWNFIHKLFLGENIPLGLFLPQNINGFLKLLDWETMT